MSSITETIYEDAASIGRFRAWIGLIVGCIAGLILFFVGLAKVYSGKTKQQSVVGKIKTVSCDKNTCTADVTYTVDQKSYISTLVLPVSSYAAEQTLTIYANSSDPKDVSALPDISGWYFIAGGVLIVLFAYLMLWISQKYKFFAAAEGVGVAGSLVKNMW
jgi:hypothetical protein